MLANKVNEQILQRIRERQKHKEDQILPYWRNAVDSLELDGLRIKWSEYIPILPTAKQLAFLMLDDYREVFFGGAARSGKVVMRDGVVLTPFGFKKIQDLRVGDRVNNPDGSIAKVIQLSPWNRYRVWRVKFSDGTHTDVAEGHLWLAWKSGKRSKKSSEEIFGEESAQVIETATLKKWSDSTKKEIESGADRIHWPLIPVCQPQHFNVSYRYRSALDPYQLGFWIGDGHSVAYGSPTVGITSADYEHFDSQFAGSDYHRKDYAHSFRGKTRKFWVDELKRLSLLGKKSNEKFIPREFKYGSIEVRTAILQGLMDTDGTVGREGKASFCSTSKQLAEDVKFLVQSLGGTATLTEKRRPFYVDSQGRKVIGYPAYVLYIRHADPSTLFRMERKKSLCCKVRSMYRRVVDVEVLGETKVGRCITVSHSNGLYITNDFIVTHNSFAILMSALQWADTPGYDAILFRRTATSASRAGGLLDTLFKWLIPKGVGFDSKINRFFFPSGASLTIGYFDSEFDYEQYQGQQYSFVAYDELDQFEERWYEKLFTRVSKSIDAPFPLRVRTASNPGGRGHAWIKKRFNIQFDSEKQIYRGFNPDRPYVPAFVWDNPHTDVEEYVASLSQVDPTTREQMLMGNWVLGSDGRFKPAWFQQKRYSTRNEYVYLSPDCKTAPYEKRKLRFFQTVDPAASSREGPGDVQIYRNKQPSYSVIATWCLIGQNLILWDIERFSAEIPEVAKRIHDNFKKRLSEGIRPEFVGIEATGTTIGVFQLCERMRLPVRPLRANSGDKIVRSTDAQNRAANGLIWLPHFNDPQSGNWLDDYEEELFRWTGHPGETADQIDATSWAAILVSQEFATADIGLDPNSRPEILSSGYGSFFNY